MSTKNIVSKAGAAAANQIKAQASNVVAEGTTSVKDAMGKAGGAVNAMTTAAGEKASALQQVGNVGRTLGQTAATAARNGGALAKAMFGDEADKIQSALGTLDSLKGLGSKIGGLASKLKGQVSGGADDAAAQAAAASAGMQLINARLADSMFVALPTDDVKAVDAYGIKGNETLNGLVSSLTKFGKESLAKAGGFKGLGEKLKDSVLGGLVSGQGLNVDAFKDRVLGALGGKWGAFNSLTDTLKDDLMGVGVDVAAIRDVKATLDGVVSDFKTSDLKSAQGVFQLLNRVTGNSKLGQLIDVGAEAQVLQTIIHEAIQWDLPDLIDASVQYSRTSEAAYYALQSNLIVAAQNGNLHALQTITNKLGRDRVLADCPVIFQMVLNGYTLPSDYDANDWDAEWVRMNTILSAVSPDWGYVYVNGERRIHLETFSSVSDDARVILSHHNSPFSVALMLAGRYQPDVMLGQLKANYPDAVF